MESEEMDRFDEETGAEESPEVSPKVSGEPVEEPPAEGTAPEPEEVAVVAVADAGEEAAPGEAPPKKWYIIHTYSGFENKVQESLRTRSEAFGFADKIGQILIPTEPTVELRNGKKVTGKRLVYPGYVMVEMEMSDALWHV